jgi:Arylsulfatase A and related enzymes
MMMMISLLLSPPRRLVVVSSSLCWFLFLFLTFLSHNFTVVCQAQKEEPLTKEIKRTRPNILLIFGDDVGTGDVPGYWNNHIVDMPNLKRLQEMGVTFLDAHSTPVCAPSRYMLLSGNYPHRGQKASGSWNFGDGKSQFRVAQKSLAHVLKRKGGYHTAMFGKWHMGLGIPEGNGAFLNETNVLTGGKVDWNQPVVDGPNDFGFDHSYFTAASVGDGPYSFFRDGYLETKMSDVILWEEGEYNTTSNNGISKIRKAGEGDVNWDSTAYNMILVNETFKFLDDHMESRGDDPFFAYVALGNVHLPHSPPKYYMDGTPVEGQYDNPHLDMLLEMDKVIGSLIGTVEERGLADNTIFIFASDNGGLNMGYPGRVIRGHKNTIWEGGHRIPLVLRYDGVFPSNEKRTKHFVGLNDIYATLAEVVDVSIPKRSAYDSVSFAKYIESEENTSGLRDFLATWNYAWRADRLDQQAIRYGDLKLVNLFDKKTGRLQSLLYNLTADIGETTDLFNSFEDRDIINLMSAELKRLGPCPNDSITKFPLSGGKRQGRLVSCNWFELQSQACDWQQVGEVNCNSICGRHQSICEKIAEL